MMSNAPLVFNLEAYLLEKKQVVEQALDASLPLAEPKLVYEAMRYSLLAGGKRLRPILSIATCELFGGDEAMAIPTACAMEMIHTMSLIHDDLPSMDNDDLRRGKPTNHKVYGEDIAILAGDGLLVYAFEYIGRATKGVPAPQVLQVIVNLARAVGGEGLVGGQVMDLQAEGKPGVTVEELKSIHTRKTGALLEVAVTSGAILAGADLNQQQGLSRYAQNIGLAFQIVDDVLDITATAEQLGKTAGKDLQAQKATYPSLWGLEKSQEQAHNLIEGAIQELQPYGEKADPLRAIAKYIIERQN
jgi:geranylgeranyl diphosphate synthase type II